MRTILFLSLLAAAVCVSTVSSAAEAMPSLLCDTATLKAPTQTGTGGCPPAPCPPAPVCAAPAPEPACPPPPPVTACAAPAVEPACPPAAPAPCATASAPARTGVRQQQEQAVTYQVVPVKRKVYEEETYTVEEKRTQVVDEVRTRVIKPKAPRVARINRGGDVALVVVKDKARVEPYVKKVKSQYTVPVTKTRKVAREIEEYEVKEVRERRWGR